MSDTTDPFEGQLDENDRFFPKEAAARAAEQDEDTEARQEQATEWIRTGEVQEVSHDEVIRLWALSEAVKLSNGQPMFGDAVVAVLKRAEKFETYLRTGEAL